MASTYTGLGTELMTTGENAGNWGTKTNTNLQILEQISGGYTAQSIAGSAQTTTLSVSDGSAGAVLAHRVIEFTGTITGNQIVTIPLDVQQLYVIKNNTSGAYTVQFKYVSGSGSSVTWGTSDKGTKLLYAAADHATNPNLVDSNIGGVGAVDLNGATLTLDADGDTDITADTDDQIDIKIAGADDFQFTANTFTAQSGSTIAAQALTATTITASGIVKTDDTTEATSTTDGSLQTDGGLSVAKDAVIGDDLKLLSDSAVLSFGADSDTTLTHTDGTGLTLNSTNKLLFGDTGTYIHQSADGVLDLVSDTEIEINATTIDINGAVAMDGAITGATNITLSGELDAATLDISGNADIDGTTNLDAVDIDGAVQLDATFTVGADDQGYDVKFFGDTASAYMLWDTSADDLVLAGAAGIDLAGDIDVDGTANLDNTDIDGTLAVDGTTISLDATTSLNIDNSNTSNGITIGTATSGVPISIGHGTSETTVNDNLTVTGDLTVNGTTTTVNSTTVTIDDPIFTLGGDSAPGSDDNKDRGIEFRYHDGSNARIGFMGYDDSATGFTFLTAATNSSEVFSGTAAKIIAGELDISGNMDIDGTSNLDAVDIDGAVQLDATFTVGADDQGYDVKLFGDTASAYMLWDTSADDLILGGAAGLIVPDGQFTLGSTAVTTTAAEINLIDGGTSRGTTAVADGDGLLVNDDGTMRMTNVTTLKTYFQTGISSAADDISAGDAAVSITTSSGNITIDAAANDSDVIFKGTDNSSDITMLTLDGSDAGSATFNHDIILGNDSFVRFGDAGEKITGDGTDLTINSSNDLHLTATTDINIPADVGLTFGNDGEKIEGDGTDLTIAGNNINLTATADVVIPANVGITFGTGEKIEGDSTDLTITSGAKINLTATSDVHIPNDVGIVFGGASEKIEGDGTDLVISANNLTVDAAADIILDAAGNDFQFKAVGTHIFSIVNSSSDIVLKPIVDAKDIIFQQRDGTEVARIEDNATFNVVTDKLAINGTAVTATAAELNLLDGGTSVGSSITLADADGIVVNDGGSMKTIPASDLKTYNPGGTSWQSVVTGNTTMVSGRGYFVNTTSAAITMTLPASPSLGDTVTVIDYAATADTNNITIGRNSQPIQGTAEDLTVATERAAFTLVYSDSTHGWLLTDK